MTTASTPDVLAVESQHVLQTYRRQPVVFERGEGTRLFDDHGRPAGRHGAGPHWQAEDGSRIVGTLVAKVLPRDEDDAIPWLLLHTRSTDASGRLAGITSVQRIHTRGGTAPARRCDDTALGRTERVPYTADYVFFEGGQS